MQVVSGVNGEPLIKDYLVLSIITTFFCFMPLGFVALIKSIEVSECFRCSCCDKCLTPVHHLCVCHTWCSSAELCLFNRRNEYYVVLSAELCLFNRRNEYYVVPFMCILYKLVH